MSSNTISHTNNDNHAHYTITRTMTDAHGKTHTKTIEVADDDASKVDMINLSFKTFCM